MDVNADIYLSMIRLKRMDFQKFMDCYFDGFFIVVMTRSDEIKSDITKNKYFYNFRRGFARFKIPAQFKRYFVLKFGELKEYKGDFSE